MTELTTRQQKNDTTADPSGGNGRPPTPMRRAPGKPAAYKRAGVHIHNKDGEPGWRLRTYDPRTDRQPEKNFYGSYEEAAIELERWRQELAAAAQPRRSDAHHMRLSTWAVQWLESYSWLVRPVGANPGVRRPETTWRNARSATLSYILPALADRTLASLTYHDCYDYIAGMRVDGGAREAAPATKATVASVLRIMLADAEKAGVLRRNPAAGLPTRWGRKKRRIVIPSLIQVEDLADAMDQIWPGRGDIVRLFAYLGLRWEELTALTWDHVDFERRSLFIEYARPSSTSSTQDAVKTEASERYAALLEQADAAIRRLKAFAERRGSAYVVCGERGGPLSYSLWRKKLKRAQAASGVPYTAHGLRHCAASILIAGGASPTEVRDQMGHSTTAVTERVYRHAIAMDRTKLAERLSRAMTNVAVEEGAESRTAGQEAA